MDAVNWPPCTVSRIRRTVGPTGPECGETEVALLGVELIVPVFVASEWVAGGGTWPRPERKLPWAAERSMRPSTVHDQSVANQLLLCHKSGHLLYNRVIREIFIRLLGTCGTGQA